MEVTNKEVAAVLRKARAHVKKGWCKKAYASEGGYCMVGAVYKASVGEAQPCLNVPQPFLYAREALISATGQFDILGFNQRSTLATWNDDPETTKADVLAAFDAALVLVEG